jgi:enoyl-CoA hydratase/carnithine racemase
MTPAPTTFRYEEAAGVATITLDRPGRLNALTFEVYAELTDLFAALADREPVRVVIITGAGRAFCSGGDVELIIGELLKRDRSELLAFTRLTGDLVRKIRMLRKPVIAAINGVAAGAGAVIALACDFRIGSPGASLAFLFTKVGLAGADMGAAFLLPRMVGFARATEMLMLGDPVSAEEAHRIGLLSRLVPHERLLDEAAELAGRLAAGPRFAYETTKELLNRELSMTLSDAIEAEAEAQAICMETAEFREGYEAFRARRPPRFP